MRTEAKELKLFPHPFSWEYWRTAARELKDVRVLVFAAMMIALRVALKSVSIPVAADLNISVAFFVNAYGAMIMGPVVASLAAAVTDTLGCILFPKGTYFFPFIFTEMAGSLIFALCLYRARITVRRVVLSRFCIDFFVNILMTTPIMSLYYRLILGKTYTMFHLPRIVKNLALFPVESVLLVLFLRALIPPTSRVGFNVPPVDDLRFTKKNAAMLIVLFALGCAAVGFYLWLRGNK
ncbi:MAG: folate family ECF transporter S component [Clostridiales bacterium]|nr:folate family ECF transporter S component [Clostridiales bacterium]